MKDSTKTIGWITAHIKSMETAKKKGADNRIKYYNNPRLCPLCSSSMLYEKRHNKFCSRSCAATFNNFINPKKSTANRYTEEEKKQKRNIDGKLEKICVGCGTQFYTRFRKSIYCNQSCRVRQITLSNFAKIEAGTYNAKTHGAYRKYLIEKFGAKCMLCNWNEKNIKTGNCPIELDHIDGNSENNLLNNLRLICPNCHSLQPTYKSLNKGKGRFSRSQRYRDGKSY